MYPSPPVLARRFAARSPGFPRVEWKARGRMEGEAGGSGEFRVRTRGGCAGCGPPSLEETTFIDTKYRKCAKTHLQQRKFSNNFRGRIHGPPLPGQRLQRNGDGDGRDKKTGTGRGKGRRNGGVSGTNQFWNAPERRYVSFFTIAVCFTRYHCRVAGNTAPVAGECTKTHLQQSIISQMFRGTTPGTRGRGPKEKGWGG